MNRIRFPWLELSILTIAFVLRIWAIEIKPPHFDEGVNGWFSDQMRVNGYYAYDPTNYHGPLHFYLVFAGQQLFGRELWALRLPAVLFSLACVWLMLRFDRFFGKRAVRWAAVAMAVSPAYVFYGRYSIHESEMVFFLMGTMWGALELWRSGFRGGMMAVLAGIAGMVLTKETLVVHLGCMLLAIPCLWIWERWLASRPDDRMAVQQWKWSELAVAVGVSVAVVLAFYSGFGHDLALIAGLGQTVEAWFSTGVVAGGHEKADYAVGFLNFYWIALMARYEWPVLVGLLYCFRLLFPSPAKLRYLAIYGAGALLAYSLIPYKTPWCILVLLWPFLIGFGAAVEELRARFPLLSKPLAAGIAVLLAVSLAQSLRLNFWNHSDPSEPYVYVQTSPLIRVLTDPLLELARKDPSAHGLTGQFLLDSYYPLPWMLGDFRNIGYYKDETRPERLDGDFIVAELSKAADLESQIGPGYARREFRLRDGQEDCVVWFKEDVFRSVLTGTTPP